jgi:hypothetical protein
MASVSLHLHGVDLFAFCMKKRDLIQLRGKGFHLQSSLANLTRDQLSDYTQYIEPIFSRYLGPRWAKSKNTKGVLWYIANSTFTETPLDIVGFEWCTDDPLDTSDLQWFLNVIIISILSIPSNLHILFPPYKSKLISGKHSITRKNI